MKLKSSAIILPLFVISLFLAACGNQDEANQPELKVTAQDLKKESKEALNSAVSHTEQRKEAYLQQIEAELEGYAQKLDKLKDGAIELTDEAKVEYNQQIAVLEQKKISVSETFDTLKSASGETWNDIKSEMDKAVGELLDAYDNVIARFQNS